MVHNGWAQALLAAVRQYQNSGSFLQWVDAWSQCDISLCFCLNRTIFTAFVNVPGSVHDSQVAYWGRVYDKLESVYQETSGKCTVDSAFGKVKHSFLIKPSPDYLVLSAPTHQDQRLDIMQKRQAMLMRHQWKGHVQHPIIFSLFEGYICLQETGESQMLMKMMCLL